MPERTISPPTPGPAWVTWPLLVALLVTIIASMSSGVLGDPDTLWHIAAGRWMVTHRALPMTDMFSWSMPGAPWTAHEWLSELLLFGTWSIAGFHGVVALVTICFAWTAAYVVRFLCRRMEPQQMLPVALLMLALIATHFLARPHVLVWPLLAVWVGTLVDTVDADRRPPWWLLALLLLWANLHASFTLGIAMAGGLGLDAIVRAPTPTDRWRQFRHWALFGVGCLVTISINPNGLGTLQHALHMMQMKETLALIDEWKSANFHEFQIILLWIALVFGLGLLGRLRLSPVRALLMVALFYLALKHVRYHSTLALGSVFLLAGPLGDALRFRRDTDDPAPLSGLDRIMERLAAPSHAIGITGTVLAMAGWFVVARPLMASAPPEGIAPADALAAYQDTAPKDGRLLNGYVFGGYLIYRNVPVFVDGRADMYGDPFMKALSTAMMLKEPHGLERYLDQHRISATMLGARSAAVEVLDHLPGWRRIYGDTVAVVHVRQAPSMPIAPTPPAGPASPPAR